LLFSIFFFFTTILLSANITLNNTIAFIFFAFILIIVALFSPITSKNRPIYSKDKLLKFKRIALFIITIHFIMYFMINKNPYLMNSIWVLLLQSIQLLIAKGGLIYEKNIK